MSNQAEQAVKKSNETVKNQIKKIASEQQEIARNKIYIWTPHLKESYKGYINNLTEPSLYTLLGKYNNNKLTIY